MKQTNNKDGSESDPLLFDYVYRLELKMADILEAADSEVEMWVFLRVHNFKSPKNVSVTELKEFEVTCSAEGKPDPTLNVVFPNGEKVNGTKSLKRNITAYRNMMGMYHCIAVNDVTDPQTKSAWLDVWFPSWCIIHPGATTVYEQGNVSLNVTTTGNPSVYEYNWTHPDGRRLSGNNIFTFTASRQDSGIYNVSVYNGVGERGYCTSNVTVQLNTKSPEITNPGKQVLEVNEGEDVNLVCNASGYPAPNITWTKSGNVIGAGRIYNIARAQKNDSSCYTCTADNGIGQAKNASICLNVQYPPSNVTILPSRRQIISKEGDNLSLICKSDSNPPPTFTWKHNGMALADGLNGNLVFNSINRRQNGTYRCEAKNHLRSLTSDPIEITVQYLDDLEVIGSSNKSYILFNPVVLFNLSVNAYPSKSYLTCNPSVPNIMTVITSHDAGLHTKQYLVVVIIQNAVHSASILCKAENGVGKPQEKALHFYRQPIPFKEKFGGQFIITNQQWQGELNDPKTAEYNNLENKCIKTLDDAYSGLPYLAGVNIKEFLKGSIIVRFELEVIGQVSDPLLPLKNHIKEKGGEIDGLQIDYNSIQKASDSKEESQTTTTVVENKILVAVLGVLFALSIVLIILLIAGFLWLRRKEAKGNFGKRSNNRDEKGQMNDISLQETSLNATDNDTPNVPEYEPIRGRGLAASNAGIPEYESVTTRTQAAQPQAGVQTNNLMPQYESADRHRQPGADSNPPSVAYQTIQPRTDDYGSLSPSTRLAPKGTAMGSTGSPTRTGEYQALQHKSVSPQYQSLDDLSKC